MMKNLLFLAVSVLLLTCSAASVARSQEIQSSEVKVKTKGGKTTVRDKSKPVRKAIEAWYAQNTAAFRQKDVAAVMALRTDDFHTVLPNGTVNTRADMQVYTERFLGRIEQWVALDFQIGTIEVQGDLASADVTQKTVRMQRLPDGQLHKVEAGVVQRETWKKTAAGWKLYRVDNIRDGDLLVDDKPYKPNQ
ncbi:MAG: YybH family protein [Blastocatellia bacterium]